MSLQLYTQLGIVASATPFSPSDISGLKLWLDASDSGTITESANAISQWDDKSGNNNHVLQGTSSNQPTYTTNSVNGLPTVKFDGINDYLQTSGIFNIVNENTMFIIRKDVVGATLDVVLKINDTGTGAARGLQLRGHADVSDRYAMYITDWTGHDFLVHPATSALDVNSYVYRRNSSSNILEINGSRVTDTNFSSGNIVYTAASPVLCLGASINGVADHSPSDIQEVIIYNRGLSEDELNKVKNYINPKWNIN